LPLRDIFQDVTASYFDCFEALEEVIQVFQVEAE
jgi:hypothetical protein